MRGAALKIAIGDRSFDALNDELRMGTGSRWVYGAAWLSFMAMYAGALGASGVRPDLAVRNAACAVLPDALLGVAILRLPRLLRWPEVDRAAFYAAHVGLLVLFLAASLMLWSVVIGLDALVFDGAFRIRIEPRIVPWRLLMGTLVYASISGIAYAWVNAAAGREHARRAAAAEALRARAELAAMRSQLRPHFILNTLHAMVGLVRRDPATAVDAIERLGDLLRYGLNAHRDGLDEVPFREEWRFVQSYLVLETMRLGDRLRLDVRIDESSWECRVPTFALQTLVENAIRHSISRRASGGRLVIETDQAGNRLALHVRDDGPEVSWDVALSGDGLGLRLLRDRVRVLYGEQGRLTLSSEEEGGTCASLEIPWRRGEP
jgi:signal transduction histidine kinase